MRVLVTGAADGLGRAAAAQLLHDGHDVVVHGRSAERLRAIGDLVEGGAQAVTGDLADPDEVRSVAEQANAIGRMDAVIHNAGVYTGRSIMPVNVVAPYLLTTLMHRPDRLVYLSSGMHRSGRAELDRIDWSGRRGSGSYSDSKLFVTTLTMAFARLWPGVLCNAVDPGWVPTKMGGPGAPDDLELGHVTQAWLATSDDAAALTTGGYWHHQQRHSPHPASEDRSFQDDLLSRLSRHTSSAHPTPTT